MAPRLFQKKSLKNFANNFKNNTEKVLTKIFWSAIINIGIKEESKIPF